MFRCLSFLFSCSVLYPLPLELEHAHELGVLALMVEGNLAAVGVGQVFRVFEVGVAVAAQNDVDAPRAANDGRVLVVGRAVAQMGEADDEVALLLVAQLIGHLLGHGRGVVVDDSLAVGTRNEALQLWGQTEDAHAHACAFLYNIRLHQALAHGAREVVVGADDGEAGHAEQAGHVLHAAVELVVAYGGGVVAHEVHQLNLHFTLKQAVVDAALREVATVQQQHVGMLLTQFLDERHAAYVSPLVGLFGLDVVGRYGLDARVCVAGVHQGQRLCREGENEKIGK